MSQTIVALATPNGRSGIGIVRLSGADSVKIACKLVGEDDFNPLPRRAILKKLYDPQTQEIIDEALITYFQSPSSFTGEDVIEVSCHGSPVLLRQIIDFCLQLDARLAEPGEFSLRALSNGKLDLSQVEAIRDLIDAQTVASARQAVRQFRGELSHQLQTLKDELLNLIVILESNLEFVEDDLPSFQLEKLQSRISEVIQKLEKMAFTYRAGRLFREGLRVALVGRPNVGKSSIFNALIGQERAIVTEIAGTTRDSLHETLSIKGVPIFLIDTAGLRETSDRVEIIGVDRTKRILVDAELVLVIFDETQELTKEDHQVLVETKDVSRLFVINKIDIGQPALNLAELPSSNNVVRISAKTGQGFNELQESIVAPFLPQEMTDSGFLVSDARHFDLLNRAKIELEVSFDLIEQRVSEEIILIGLHNAMRLIGEITGETTNEDILTRIFATFCIGK